MAYFDSDGVQIYFEEHGKGEPVVLVHGFASRAEHNWGAMNWFDALAAALPRRRAGLPRPWQERQATRFGGVHWRDDGRGRDPADGSPGNQAHAHHGLLDGRANRNGIVDVASGASAAAVLGGIGAPSATAPIFDRKPIVDALLAKDISEVKEQRAREFRQFAEITGNDLKALAAIMASNREDFPAEKIAAKKIRVPVMIVIGTKDLLVGNPKLLHESIPGSKLVMLEGQDHLSAPGDTHYKEAVLEFFKSAPA